MILAGDIGATKCNLALYGVRDGMLYRFASRRYVSRNYSAPEAIIADFLQSVPGKVLAAGFGVAGPVIGHAATLSNLGWTVDAEPLARVIGVRDVLLLNDMEATAYSLAALPSSDLFPLHHGTPVPRATQAVIAAGTGLGECILWWNGKRYVAVPTEGGHADFAPSTEEQAEMLLRLKEKHRNVSCEMLLSGRGFQFIHEYLDPEMRHSCFDDPQGDSAPVITRNAYEGSCAVCVHTVDLWVSIYGAETGNLALHSLALGGVYVAGGIAVKLLDKLRQGEFARAFSDKSRLGSLLAQTPITVVLNEEAPVWGAAAQVASMLGT